MNVISIHIVDYGPADLVTVELKVEVLRTFASIAVFDSAQQALLHRVVVQLIGWLDSAFASSGSDWRDHIVLLGSQVVNLTVVPESIDVLPSAALSEGPIVDIVEPSVGIVA